MSRALAGGFALALVAAAPLVVGAARGPRGIELELAPAPPGVAGPGRGPWVVAWFVNRGRAPAPLCWSDPPGEELSFTARQAGQALAAVRGAEDATLARSAPIRRTWLPPGGRLGLRVDLSRVVALPASGEVEVRASRGPWGDPRGGFDGVRCESPPLVLPAPE